MKKRIKILHAIRQAKVGGGETHVMDLASSLDPNLYESVVLAFTEGPMIGKLRELGIRSEIIPTEKPFDLKTWKRVSDFIEREEFDLVHAHGTRAMSNVFRPAKKAGLPLIYTVHGWSFHQDQDTMRNKISVLAEKYLTRRADKVLCVSHGNEEEGRKRFGLKSSEVIHNAINPLKFNVNARYNDIRRNLGIPEKATLVSFIARMTKQKDPLTMIKAMNRVLEESDDVVLLMVGDGELKEAAQKLAAEHIARGRIIFQPFRSDIPAVLAASDIYVLPSLWEGFPIGILEAMAMEVSVIASPVDGNTELVEDGKTGLIVDHSDPKKLADSILLLHRNQKLREVLAQNAGRITLRTHTIDKLAEKVGAVYKQMCWPLAA